MLGYDSLQTSVLRKIMEPLKTARLDVRCVLVPVYGNERHQSTAKALSIESTGLYVALVSDRYETVCAVQQLK